MPKRISGKIVAMLALIAIVCTGSVRGADNLGVLQGVVKDAAGAPVAGAFVKMKNADRRLTFMVISQAQGRYTANVPPGKYVVQGVGGEYESALSAQKDVAAGQSATVDLALTGQRAPALPNAWPGRPPGQGGGEAAATAPLNLPDGNGKPLVAGKCSVCHDAARIANARYDRARWQTVVDDMQAYAQGSDFARELTSQEVNVLYSVQGDPKSKLVWFSEQQADQIARFNPATQTFTEFPLATAEEDHRRIEIDPNNRNRIWWSGDLSGRMGYIELLDGKP